jgi:hypothetical protein
MPDTIYSGAETRLITDRDNDSIKGIRRSAMAPTHVGLRLPGKKPHASGKNPWTSTQERRPVSSLTMIMTRSRVYVNQPWPPPMLS